MSAAAITTVRIWRLVHRRYAATPYDGEGAARTGGRWNAPGAAVAYASEALSLAALELLVHLDAVSVLGRGFVAVPADLPADAIETLPASALPDGIARVGAAALVEIGHEWLDSKRSLALRVPSAVVAVEWNVLVNPRHPRMAEVVVGAALPWAYDERLARR